MYIKVLLIGLTISLGLLQPGSGQDPLHIALLNDDSLNFSRSFEDLFKQEINVLQSTRNDVNFISYYPGQNPQRILAAVGDVMSDDDIDIIIGVGLATSTVLSQLPQYAKPTISSIIIDRNLLGLPITEQGTSGVDNFAYVQSPFDVKKDLEIFHRIVPFKNLAVLLDNDARTLPGLISSYFQERVPEGASYTLLGLQSDVSSTLELVTDDFDALYVLSTAQYSDEESQTFYHELSERGIPSFALTGRDQVELGAMAGLASSSFIPNLARRIAIDVLKITEGTNPSDLPVEIEILEDDFVINMHTLKHLEIYPDFDLLNQAILLHLADIEGSVTWSIESLIFEALNTNLRLSAAKKNLLVADQDISIAGSNLQPQIKVNSSATWIDQTRVDNSNGQAASVSWLASATMNQLIYSEPAMANVAIQKILREAESAALRQVELDIILETAQAFLGYLQAKSNVSIQNKNVDVTSKNLDISRSKERLGYSGISDVYRLQTQLAQNVIGLNTAVSNLSQARININRIINRDQREEFDVVDVTQEQMISLASDSELAGLINNQKDLDALADFFVSRALQRLPELQEFDYSIRAQERSLLSNKRSLYLPQISLQAGADKPIKYFGAGTPPAGIPGLSTSMQYSAGAQVSIPLFEGGLRKANIQRDLVVLDQLADQRQDYQNSLEASLRSSMQVLSASYQQVALSTSAAAYSQENFNLVQDLYRQGQADIIRLVDAQNASLTAELNANNALYQLMSDFLSVERAMGDFFFLMSDDEKSAFIVDFMDSILKD